ncbi:MetQ/NlpA family ABC transporter substrate-binding protein [Planococcus salinus]|uniref:Lipoprotein n=1 Tax=Planococcus salinus TaxID=1848460 RepID=A0A3M8P6R7_9BACL|nr:MetQ/NlpA family ABC transporter substrate-binding protein [Planococcus salinus]RNF38894.1 MetQ/NlpA family ABC transporter substrate-binding protein [Planococcus salinus]
MKKTILSFVTLLSALILLSACNSTSGEELETVTIGVTGADGPIWEVMKEKAEAEGINIELVEFSDYIQPNNALVNKEIDMNNFQHLAFLAPFMVENNISGIVPIGSTSTNPTALYSDKYQDISELPNGSLIGVSDDPANLGRGLKLLETEGLIEIDEAAGIYPTPDDIISNPKELEFHTMVSQQTARVLPDVAASLVNGGIAGQAGLTVEEALIYDDPNSEAARPYISVFAVRTEDKDKEAFKKITELYHEQDVYEAVKEDSNGVTTAVKVAAEDLQKTLDELMGNIKSQSN